MKSDGGLRKIFRSYVPALHWTSVETGGTAGGVPDMNYLGEGGLEGWLENKCTKANAVDMEVGQMAWILRRVRLGGRVRIAVRRLRSAGPRVEARDELWLFHGRDVAALSGGGLSAATPLVRCLGPGPARWDWEAVRRALLSP